jgi:hypothetical protein
MMAFNKVYSAGFLQEINFGIHEGGRRTRPMPHPILKIYEISTCMYLQLFLYC